VDIGPLLLTAGLLAVSAAAAAPAGYRAGVARLEAQGIHAEAVAIEDSRGNRAVLVRTSARISQVVADLAGARAEQQYQLRRACLLLESTGPGTAPVAQLADAMLTAAGAALGDLQPAQLGFSQDSGALLIATPSGAPRAWFPNAGPGPVKPVRGPIRCAFRMLDRQSRLATRDTDAAPARAAYSVQAIRFGSAVTLAALSGDVPPSAAARLAAGSGSQREPVLVVGRANGEAAFDEGLAGQGLKSVLTGVGRR
jgi:hypothetical protein